MGLLLNLTINQLKSILYFEKYVIVDAGDSGRDKGELIDEEEYHEYLDEYGDKFVAMIGGEAIKEMLTRIDVDAEIREIRAKIQEKGKVTDRRFLKRLEVFQFILVPLSSSTVRGNCALRISVQPTTR
jgi:DNA-directed RNA polymerase subunit beta'